LNWRISLACINNWFRRFYERLYERLQDIGVEEGMTFLDVGCGLGFYSFPASLLVGKNGSVYALDVSPGYLEWVRKGARKTNRMNIETIRADATNTGLPDDSVDMVFLHLVLHDIQDRKLAMGEFHRILKSSGRLVIDEEDLISIEDIKSLAESQGFELFKCLHKTIQIFKKT